MTRRRVWASLGIRPESVGNPPGIRFIWSTHDPVHGPVHEPDHDHVWRTVRPADAHCLPCFQGKNSRFALLSWMFLCRLTRCLYCLILTNII